MSFGVSVVILIGKSSFQDLARNRDFRNRDVAQFLVHDVFLSALMLGAYCRAL